MQHAAGLPASHSLAASQSASHSLAASQPACAPQRRVRCSAADAVSKLNQVEAVRQAASQMGGLFAPPLTDQPGDLLQQQQPFLTKQAGVLLVKPNNLGHALHTYGR